MRGTPAGGMYSGGGISPLSRGPIPSDIAGLLGVLFLTFVMQFFSLTAALPALLRLSPLIFRGAIWQLLSYAFCGFGPASLWFLFSLLMIYWFGTDVFRRLGRKFFWKTTLSAVLIGSLCAILIRALGMMLHQPSAMPFVLMQGQYTLLSILVAAWATLYSSRTILLFFVLPIRASWFIPLEILFAFMGFLNTRDFSGFIGISAAVLGTWLLLQPGGPTQGLGNFRLRLRRMWIEMRLARLRRKRNLHVVDEDRYLN